MYMKDAYVVKQTWNLAANSVFRLTRKSLELSHSAACDSEGHIDSGVSQSVKQWSDQGQTAWNWLNIRRGSQMSWAGKVTALMLVSQMEPDIKKNAPDLNGERYEGLSLLSLPWEWLDRGNQEVSVIGKRQMSCSSLKRAMMTQGAEGWSTTPRTMGPLRDKSFCEPLSGTWRTKGDWKQPA